MARRLRFPGISTALAFAGLLASLSAGCLCKADPPQGQASMGCHEEPPGDRLAASCCCEVAPQPPAVAESFRSTAPAERAAPSAESPYVVAITPEGRSAVQLPDRRIDRAPPPSFVSPLRI